MHPIVLSVQTFSLGHILIDSVSGGIVPITHGNDKAVAVTDDDRDGVRRRTTTCKVRRLLRRKISPRYQTLDVGGAQAPPAAMYRRGFNKG